MNRKKIFYIASEYWCYIANGKNLRNTNRGLLSVSIGLIPDPAPNPLILNPGGTVSGCDPNATITVWLTDSNGNQTFGTGTLTQQSDGSWTWSASFPPMPAGDYTFTVQVQYDGQTSNASTDVTLADPSSQASRKRRVRRQGRAAKA